MHSRAVLDKYAQCLVTLDGPMIRKMVTGDPNSRSFDRWRKNLNALCMIQGRDPYYTNPDNVTLRFALAEVIVRDLRGGPAVLNVSPVPPLTHPEGPVAESKGSQPTFAYSSRLGECVVRKNPGGAAALLNTGLATEEERAAVEALLPSARTCVPPPSERLKIDMVSLRGTVAFNYLRLAKAAQSTGRGNPEAAE
jgi:hypothetical protein